MIDDGEIASSRVGWIVELLRVHQITSVVGLDAVELATEDREQYRARNLPFVGLQ